MKDKVAFLNFHDEPELEDLICATAQVYKHQQIAVQQYTLKSKTLSAKLKPLWKIFITKWYNTSWLIKNLLFSAW